MTRIGGPGGPRRPEGPSGPGGPGRPEGPDEARGAEFKRGLGGASEAAGAQGARGAYEVTDATYGRVRGVVESALGEGLSREQILERVIDAEIQAHFGANASEEMARSVSQAFQDNSQLQSLFNQILAHVREASGGSGA